MSVGCIGKFICDCTFIKVGFNIWSGVCRAFRRSPDVSRGDGRGILSEGTTVHTGVPLILADPKLGWIFLCFFDLPLDIVNGNITFSMAVWICFWFKDLFLNFFFVAGCAFPGRSSCTSDRRFVSAFNDTSVVFVESFKSPNNSSLILILSVHRINGSLLIESLFLSHNIRDFFFLDIILILLASVTANPSFKILDNFFFFFLASPVAIFSLYGPSL